jgi:hypothetical protein
MPGGSVATGFGKVAQSVFGPHAVVGYEDVKMGHPQWDEMMSAIREADRRNADAGRAGRAREGFSAGTRSAPRGTAPGRRGARDSGGGAEGRGGNTRDNEGKSSADRHSRGNY